MHLCVCARARVCEPFVLLHLKRPSGSVNSVHHNPGVCVCVRFLRRRALVCVCWSVDGVSSDCSDNREPPSIRLCASLVLKLRECRQTESYQSEGKETGIQRNTVGIGVQFACFHMHPCG